MERAGMLLVLENPRARLSTSESRGKIFSALGELLWYLSGSNETKHITYYIKQYKKDSELDGTIHGAYGPRLIRPDGVNQLKNIIALLRNKPTSRRAVVQLFSADDLVGTYADVPCTCTIQFLARGKKLDAIVHMRSNDAYWGLPHDVFAFTMIQELIARSLDLELGEYRHFVGSLHIYDEFLPQAKAYVNEGWQGRSAMPAMPKGDQFNDLARLLKFEKATRTSRRAPSSVPDMPKYWKDLATLLRIFRAQKHGARESHILEMMNSTDTIFHPYILPYAGRAAARDAAGLARETPEQNELFENTNVLRTPIAP
jgi:thymidylate synthase